MTINDTLDAPWGMDFLPDGRFIITQRRGSMVIVSLDGATKSVDLSGVPGVYSVNQGGLLDVVVDPDFSVAGNNWVYFSYSGGTPTNNSTMVARARLSGTSLTSFQVIFEQLPKVSADAHYGSRLVFARDKTLFITLGERQRLTPAQDLGTHFGKVVRINRDGSVPSGNPSLGAGAQPEIWTYGHRNPQGAALHPTTGELWVAEHGPLGGDEINLAKPGRNFGWPNISYGCPYGTVDPSLDCAIGNTRGVHAPYTEPVSWWPAPSTAPSNLIFYTGDKFPEWQGNILMGALQGGTLWRIVLNGDKEASRHDALPTLGKRVRDVAQGPDGWIYLLLDEGKLVRVER